MRRAVISAARHVIAPGRAVIVAVLHVPPGLAELVSADRPLVSAAWIIVSPVRIIAPLGCDLGAWSGGLVPSPRVVAHADGGVPSVRRALV